MFDLNKEKLRCMLVLDDTFGPKLSSEAGLTYWRGFILENRKSGEIYATFRFAYADGKKSWFKIGPRPIEDKDLAIQDLRIGMECVLMTALAAFKVETKDAIWCYYPPDDGGDATKTILWLDQQGLVDFKVKRQGPPQHPAPTDSDAKTPE